MNPKPGQPMWWADGCMVYPVIVGEEFQFIKGLWKVFRQGCPEYHTKEGTATPSELFDTELDAINWALNKAQVHVDCLTYARDRILKSELTTNLLRSI